MSRKWRFALFGLCVGIVAAIAAFAFILAFGGNWDYMVRVARYSRHIGWMGPATVEGLLVVTFVAILALAKAPFLIRAQLWVIFVGSAIASVTGNVLDAMDRAMSMPAVITRGSWPLFVIAGTAVCVLLVKYFLGIEAMTRPESVTLTPDPGLPEPKPPLSLVHSHSRPTQGRVSVAPLVTPESITAGMRGQQWVPGAVIPPPADRPPPSPPPASGRRVATGNTTRSRLSPEDKAEIFSKVNGGPVTNKLATELAARYGVSVKTIRRAAKAPGNDS